MTEGEILKQRLKLKQQAVKVMREDIHSLRVRLHLLRLRNRLSARINGKPDRDLSAQLDAVDFLIQALRGEEDEPDISTKPAISARL